MMDEKLGILKMVEEGTITAEQAAELMVTMNMGVPEVETVMEKTSYDKKMFHVIVDSADGDKVDTQFPVGAIKKILKVVGKLPISEKNLKGVDIANMMDAVSEYLDAEIEGDFVDVDAMDRTTVRIFVDK